MTPNPIIALLTDFGLADTYVGTMKGVALGICPSARLVDLTHYVPPQDVRGAAYLLWTSFRYLPQQTVFLIVVDPGVGTAREPVAVETAHGTYVAPNNGVLSFVLPHVEVRHAVKLEAPRYRLASNSQTFHGRDIFAPAAAHLAAGVPITELGPAVPELVKLDPPQLSVSEGVIDGEVIYIDHFGNIITSIGHLAWENDTLTLTPTFGKQDSEALTFTARACQIEIAGQSLRGVLRTYGATARGDLLALVGSSGQLEIGVNQGSAAGRLHIQVGDPVRLVFDE